MSPIKPRKKESLYQKNTGKGMREISEEEGDEVVLGKKTCSRGLKRRAIGSSKYSVH